MNYFKKNKILIWIIIILLATNIATITTIIYHSYTDDYNTYKPEKIRIPDYKLGRFIRDELDLTKEQHEQFRSFRKDFHIEASKIAKQLKTKIYLLKTLIRYVCMKLPMKSDYFTGN
ncbi:MAG: hypothetical protein K8R58_08345 [Bacteroidales bacterium]|nr:hypothetical protein [Bacteroidales bacterium]